jgi:ribose/xylose/arabinose/galactoside ABC-type transport system permease subunit
MKSFARDAAESGPAAGQTELSQGRRPQTESDLLRFYRHRGFLRSGLTLTVLILIGMVIVFSVISPQFFSAANMFNIFEQNAVFGIMACGMAFMIIIGGFDLSVGSTAALTGIVVAYILRDYPGALIVAVLAGLAVGALAGLCNGLLISKVGINPFITTFGMMVILRGMVFGITEGKSVYGFPFEYNIIGMGKYGGVLPLPLTIWLTVVLICYVVLKHTRYGQYVYAVGGNETVAHLSGINADRIRILSAVLCGVMASLGGIVLLFRVMSALPQAGSMYELYAIAATVLGGCALGGGVGGVVGTVVGVLLLGVVINGLHMVGVSAYWEQTVTGLIIIVAVAIGVISQRMSAKA